jgi:hypothetical protein
VEKNEKELDSSAILISKALTKNLNICIKRLGILFVNNIYDMYHEIISKFPQ